MALFDFKNRAVRNRNNLRSTLASNSINNRSTRTVNDVKPKFENLNTRRQGLARQYRNNQILQGLESQKLRDQQSIRDRDFREDQANLNRQDRLDQQNYSRSIDQRNFQANRDDARFSQGLAGQRLDLAREGQEFGQGLAQQRLDLAQQGQEFGQADSNRRFEAGQDQNEFSRGIAQQQLELSKKAGQRADNQQQQNFYFKQQELDQRNNQLKAQGLASQQKARQDFIKNMKPGYVVGQAEKLGINIDGLYDENGDQTLAGDKFLHSVNGYMQKGANEEQAMRMAGGDMMASSQQDLQSEVDTLQSMQGKDGFTDDDNLLLKQKSEELQESALALHRFDRKATNPVKTEIIKEYDSAVDAAKKVASGVKGDNPESLTRRANKVAKFFEKKNIDLDQLGEGLEIFGESPSETAIEMQELLKHYDPELEKLYDEVANQEKRINTGNNVSDFIGTPTSVAAGLAKSRALQQGGNRKDLHKARRALYDYLNERGPIR